MQKQRSLIKLVGERCRIWYIAGRRQMPVALSQLLEPGRTLLAAACQAVGLLVYVTTASVDVQRALGCCRWLDDTNLLIYNCSRRTCTSETNDNQRRCGC